MEWENAFSDVGVATHSSQMTLGADLFYFIAVPVQKLQENYPRTAWMTQQIALPVDAIGYNNFVS